jgi:hypothetical protein
MADSACPEHASIGHYYSTCPGCNEWGVPAPKLTPRDETLALLFSRMSRAGVTVDAEQAEIFAGLPDAALLAMVARYSAVTESYGPLNTSEADRGIPFA